MASEPIEYKEDMAVQASQEVLNTWHAVPAPDGGFTTNGLCPACTHQTALALHPDAEYGAESAEAAPDPATRTTRLFRCHCHMEHPGRPATVLTGCGRRWTAAVEPDGQSWRLSADVDPLAAQAALELSSPVSAELTSARTLAEKWLPGLAALYGLFAIAGAVVGRETVKDLSDDARTWLFVTLVVGALLAAVSIVLGYGAAFGWLRIGKGQDVSTDDKLILWYRTKGRKAVITVARRLWIAVGAALGSLACLIVSLGLVWLGPPKKPATAPVTVTYRQNGQATAKASLCGTISADPPPQHISLRVTDGPATQTISLPASWVEKIEPTNNC
ncbi:hypothetical protein [Streptomyces sp. DSM 41634]|uniref:hypothetical protein n=1 Tax=Streptomyces sp. DSM 41634 TaxID=3448656 RepID=UPI00403FCEC6